MSVGLYKNKNLVFGGEKQKRTEKSADTQQRGRPFLADSRRNWCPLSGVWNRFQFHKLFGFYFWSSLQPYISSLGGWGNDKTIFMISLLISDFLCYPFATWWKYFRSSTLLEKSRKGTNFIDRWIGDCVWQTRSNRVDPLSLVAFNTLIHNNKQDYLLIIVGNVQEFYNLVWVELSR